MTKENEEQKPTSSVGEALPTLGVAVILVAVGVCAVTIFFLASNVRQEIDALASANSDTTQWSLAQTEVDLLALQVAVHAAANAEERNLSEVRRRFDIFYSRVRTLAESRQFSELRFRPEAQADLKTLTDFLDSNVATFDSADPALLSALPGIETEMEDLRSQVRAFSLLGVSLFASASDERREAVAALLTRIGLLTLALVITLMMFVFVLLGMIRRSVQTERDIAATRNRLQQVISTSIDGILAVGQDGRIIDYNGAAERIFGYTQHEALGQDMADMIIPDHLRGAHNAGMERYRATGEKRVVGSGLLRLEAKRKDGTVFPAEVVISSVESGTEEIFVSYIRDISKQVAAENELVQARDKAVAGEKAKAELLAVMSHEMRTPLNGLLGTMELMEDTNLASSQRKYLSAMETSAKLLLHHVNDVLNISSAEAGKLNLIKSEIDPASFLDELIESQRRAIESNGNRITFAVSAKPERIWTDRIRLNQIILNLVGNANKFTRGGEIVVEYDSLSDGSQVEFRVIDNGIGISEKDQLSIFEDFRTLDSSYGRAAEGTGLGLAISKRLVQALGGEIGVESEPGEGSLFWVRLPAGSSTTETIHPDKTNSELSPVRKRKRSLEILLVEDNKINRLVARDMLEKAGHKVIEAHDGREGIHFAGQIRYDAILMDISMPEIDGVTATETIREADGPNCDTPIVALTAHALPEDLERFKNAGVTDTLIKPVTKDALARVLGASMPAHDGGTDTETSTVLEMLSEQVGRQEAIALLDQFVEENDELTRLLKLPIATTDARLNLAERVHRSAGSASVYRTEELVERLKELETVLRHDNGKELPKAKSSFGSAWTKAKAELLACRTKLIKNNCE